MCLHVVAVVKRQAKVFRDCKDGLLAAEGERSLGAWLPKKGFFVIHHLPGFPNNFAEILFSVFINEHCHLQGVAGSGLWSAAAEAVVGARACLHEPSQGFCPSQNIQRYFIEIYKDLATLITTSQNLRRLECPPQSLALPRQLLRPRKLLKTLLAMTWYAHIIYLP